MEFAVKILIALGVIRLLRKSLETTDRIPEWDKVLSKIWIPSIILLVIENVTPVKFFSDWYWKIIYLLIFFKFFNFRIINFFVQAF